jgi:hypothetical protein
MPELQRALRMQRYGIIRVCWAIPEACRQKAPFSVLGVCKLVIKCVNVRVAA